MTRDLDPDTLRAVARQLDERGLDHRRECRCVIHGAMAEQCDSIAARLRTLAIQSEQARHVPAIPDAIHVAPEIAADILNALRRCPAEQRADTLAVVTKILVEGLDPKLVDGGA